MPTNTSNTTETELDTEAMTPLIVEGHPVTAPERLTPEERKDFQKLEKRFEKGQRESIAALKEIFDRRLYRENYPNQDEYMRVRWGRTRQWADQQFKWLHALDLLEQHNVSFDKITADDAVALSPLREDPAAFVRAFLEAQEAAARQGRKRTKKMLTEAVSRQERYAEQVEQHPDLTYGEYLDLACLGPGGTSAPNLVQLAQERGPLPDSLVQVCNEKEAMPVARHLLAVARGQELHDLVELLAPLASRWEERRDAEAKLRELEQETNRLKLKLHRASPIEEEEIEEDENDEDQGEQSGVEEEVEEQEEEGRHYDVILTGEFLLWVQARFAGVVEGHISLPQDSLTEVLAYLCDGLNQGCQITHESSIVVKPAVKDS